MDEFDKRMTAWGPGILPSLAKGLESASPAYRAASLYGIMVVTVQKPSDPEMIERVCHLATDDSDAGVRMWAFASVGGLHALTVKEVRRKGVQDPDWHVRSVAINGLNPVVDDLDLDPLLAALGDDHDEVRYTAADRVEELRERRAIPALIQLALNDHYERTAAKGVHALGHMKATEALPALRQLADGRHQEVAGAAIDAVIEISAPAAVDLLIGIVDQDSHDRREYATTKLIELKDRRAVPSLLTMMQDPKSSAAGHAIIALCKLGDAAVIEPILSRLETWTEPALSDARSVDGPAPIFGGTIIRLDMEALIQAVDHLPMSPDQRKRWEGLRQR